MNGQSVQGAPIQAHHQGQQARAYRTSFAQHIVLLTETFRICLKNIVLLTEHTVLLKVHVCRLLLYVLQVLSKNDCLLFNSCMFCSFARSVCCVHSTLSCAAALHVTNYCSVQQRHFHAPALHVLLLACVPASMC